MRYELVDTKSGSTFEVSEFPLTIGRGDEAAICLNDRFTSRLHCEVVRDDKGLLVRDLGSRHGTLINGETIVEMRVDHGDVLSIGLQQLQFKFAMRDAEVAS